MENKSIRVNLTTRQIENLIFAANGGDISTLHPTRMRSLRYAVKALQKAKDAAGNAVRVEFGDTLPG